MDSVGIDVHKKQSPICTFTETGEILHQRLETQRERFAAVFAARPQVRIRRQRVVIEHAQRTDAHVGRVVVLVEAEVPTGAEPTAISREDFLVATYF